jgi:FAD/FMN-containing dehydrogenase
MHYQEDFKQALGEAVSFDPQILRSYDHDLGEMPRALMALVEHRPQAVVAARTVDDVVKSLVLAQKHGIPVTPRGQATSGYGGAVPCRGGLVLDLSNLTRVIDIDVEKATVDVEPGVVWQELSRMLAARGLDNRVYPTSAPSSTVGGWFAMGGVGIGSLRYGSIRDNVLEIDVAGLDGVIRTWSGAEMEPYHQTCGALGIVTRLRLACRPCETLTLMAARLPDAAGAARFMSDAEKSLAPYSAMLQSAEYCRVRAEVEGHTPVITSGFLATLAVPASAADEAGAERLAATHGGALLGRDIAAAEWTGRFYPMRIKKAGPSILVGECFIPLDGFAAWWRDLRAALPKDEPGLEAVAVRGGRLAVLVYLLDHAGSSLYPLRMAKAMIPLRIAARRGGTPYAGGMWFSALAKRLFGPGKYRQVKQLKRLMDGRGLLNPGTINGPALPLLPFVSLSRCILAGTAFLAPLAARLSYKHPRPPEAGDQS